MEEGRISTEIHSVIRLWIKIKNENSFSNIAFSTMSKSGVFSDLLEPIFKKGEVTRTNKTPIFHVLHNSEWWVVKVYEPLNNWKNSNGDIELMLKFE
jgi:hypothetical protein